MRTYTPREPERNQDVTAMAGTGVEQPEAREAESVTALVQEAIKNFMENPITIVEGLTFSQYELLTTLHFYLNSRFETGDKNENGEDRFFHNIIVPRNAHATKNIDLDSKDLLITSDHEEGWWFSFLLRNEIHAWMRKPHVQFGKLLNDLATNLPNFGKVIWKKCGHGDDVYIKEVDLRDAIFDPSAPTIKDSGMFIERTIMAPWEIMAKVREKEGAWDKQAAIRIIRKAQAKKDKFLKQGSPTAANDSEYSLTDTQPNADVYEIHGWFPKQSAMEAGLAPGGYDDDEEAYSDEGEDNLDVDYVYCKIVIGGIEDDGTGEVLFIDECDPEDFPYMEFNYFRRVPGRCLPQGNGEVLIPLQIRINELVNRFFSALRTGSLHLWQTTGRTAYKNLLQDAQDGDIIETDKEITAIPTELRAFNQYQVELNNIETHADRLCNTVEVVTGESLPTNTPFRLGAQLQMSANKIFDQVREDIGMTLTHVFEQWILPNIMDEMSIEHVLDIMGSVDEIKMFDEQYRNYLMIQSLKDFILGQERLPTEEEMLVAKEQLAEQLKTSTRKVQVEKGYFVMDKIKSLRIYFDFTDERKNFSAEKESMSNLLQIIAANPAILQSEEARTLIGRIMEYSGISPLLLASFASKPTDPKMAPDKAAAPAAEAYAASPGDAGQGADVRQTAAAGA